MVDRDRGLRPRDTPHDHGVPGREVPPADLDPQRVAPQLRVHRTAAEWDVGALIEHDPDPRVDEGRVQRGGGLAHPLACLDDRDQYLHRRQPGRDAQAGVVPVRHDHAADHAGAGAPRRGPRVLRTPSAVE